MTTKRRHGPFKDGGCIEKGAHHKSDNSDRFDREDSWDTLTARLPALHQCVILARLLGIKTKWVDQIPNDAIPIQQHIAALEQDRFEDLCSAKRHAEMKRDSTAWRELRRRATMWDRKIDVVADEFVDLCQPLTEEIMRAVANTLLEEVS